MTHYKPDMVIYHYPCNDGFAAAYACWKLWGDDVEYIPANYGHNPPDVTDKHVLIVDFSYKEPVLVEMAKTAKSIVVLDHHKTAQADLARFRVAHTNQYLHFHDINPILAQLKEHGETPIIASFNMANSGAILAWYFCHGAEKAPPLIMQMVEDRDLWLFQLEDSKAFNIMLKTIPAEFEDWDELASKPAGQARRESRAMMRYYDYLVHSICQRASWIVKDEHSFVAVNSPPELSSDVCNTLLKMYPETPFAGSFSISKGYRGWSLRSDDTREDVSVIAQSYGGGGHRNAAGFSEAID